MGCFMTPSMHLAPTPCMHSLETHSWVSALSLVAPDDLSL